MLTDRWLFFETSRRLATSKWRRVWSLWIEGNEAYQLIAVVWLFSRRDTASEAGLSSKEASGLP